MKACLIFLTFLVQFSLVRAQRIQSIVPTQPVVVGTAFQVQYVISDPSALVSLQTPEFDSLRVVSGPNYYKGSALVNGQMQSIRNITYTLVPVKTGQITIRGITASFRNEADQRTEDFVIHVIEQPPVSFSSKSSYTDVALYAPSNAVDKEKLARENLFVKTIVSRQSCYIGEPVVATFKLFSRLQSTSEVVDAPSLYGFTVMDILDIRESHQAVETIGGKVFNTSILRKVQLYPDQTGELVIDEMQLENEVEFDDSIDLNTASTLSMMTATSPVSIRVKPLPGRQPESFTGAVGDFSIKAMLKEPAIHLGGQETLVVEITGNGNFIQFGKPLIHWPANFDVFDAVIVDKLNKNMAPLQGTRTYTIGFTADSAGTYRLPPIEFSFFDPQAVAYKTVVSDSLSFEILPGMIKQENTPLGKAPGSGKFWLAFVIIALMATGWWFFIRKKEKVEATTTPAQGETSVTSFTAGLASIAAISGKECCVEINRILADVLKRYPVLADAHQSEWQAIRSECGMVIYSDLEEEIKTEALRQRAIDLVREIEKAHSAYL